MDNLDLKISNSFTHMRDTENSHELNVIRCSPYIIDDLLLQSMENCKYGLNILRLNCQSLHANFDYIRLLIDKFIQKDCPSSPRHMFARNLVFFGNGSISLLNPMVSYDPHWALCI